MRKGDLLVAATSIVAVAVLFGLIMLFAGRSSDYAVSPVAVEWITDKDEPEASVDRPNFTSTIQEELRDGKIIDPPPPPKVEEKPAQVAAQKPYTPSPGGRLTKSSGVFNGPSGVETWYNLDMSGVIGIMRKAGYSESEYPYWIRDDGVKMLGDYVMVAGDIINTRKRGDIVETSLGTGLVCDHCERARIKDPTLIDIAVNW